jgi:predicted RNase H-like HicB family nuclease
MKNIKITESKLGGFVGHFTHKNGIVCSEGKTIDKLLINLADAFKSLEHYLELKSN